MDGRRPWIALLVATLLPLGAAAACTSPSAPAPAPAPPFVPAPPGTAQVPAQVIDLANWYLTLPTGESNRADEIHQPQLNTFTDPWFHLDDTRTGVVFTANAGGVTTTNSTYPRSELREMTCRALDGMADEGYRLDNRMVEDGGRFDTLSQVFDAVTFWHIDALGQAAGWRG